MHGIMGKTLSAADIRPGRGTMGHLQKVGRSREVRLSSAVPALPRGLVFEEGLCACHTVGLL